MFLIPKSTTVTQAQCHNPFHNNCTRKVGQFFMVFEYCKSCSKDKFKVEYNKKNLRQVIMEVKAN